MNSGLEIAIMLILFLIGLILGTVAGVQIGEHQPSVEKVIETIEPLVVYNEGSDILTP